MTESLRKTVCFFNSNRAWGGGEKWHLEAAQDLKQRGHQVYLVTNTVSELRRRGNDARVLTYSFGMNNLSFLNPIKILVIAAFLKAKKIDTIILNLPIDLKVAGMAAKLAGVKNIIYRRGMPHPLRPTWLNRLLFTKVLTRVIVNSLDVKKSLVTGNEAWFPLDKVFLLYNGIKTNMPQISISPLYTRKEHELVIGNAGRLTEQKGQKYLVELAKILKAQGVTFKLLIAGEGELKASLQELIQKENLADEVKLLGHVKEMKAFYQSLDVFVFPSLWEGMSNTLIEVMWQGVPVIAWDVSSNAEIIDDGINGYLIKPFELNKMVEIVKTFKPGSANSELNNAAQLKVRNNFSHEEAIKKLETII